MAVFHVGFPSPTIAGLSMSERPGLARLCEELGFDTLWHSNERFFHEMFICMTVSALSTQRIGIGGAVADPYAVHPALTAQSLGTLAACAEGRVTLALGAGGSGFPALGIERRRPAAALREATTVIRRLLAGEAVTFDGEIIHTRRARLHFTPGRKPTIWIASRGDRVLDAAGATADGALIATYANPDGIRHALACIRKGAARSGRTLDDLRIMARVDTCVHPDARAAYAGCREMVAKMLWLSYPDRRFVQRSGLRVPAELERLIARREYDLITQAAELVPDELVAAFCWAGTPGMVADRVVQIGRDCGVREFGFWLLCAPGQSRQEALRLVASEVLPRVRAGLA